LTHLLPAYTHSLLRPCPAVNVQSKNLSTDTEKCRQSATLALNHAEQSAKRCSARKMML
jgi:hypothetical protein